MHACITLQCLQFSEIGKEWELYNPFRLCGTNLVPTIAFFAFHNTKNTSLAIGDEASEILVLETSLILQMFHIIPLYVTINALTVYVLYDWMHEFSELGLGKSI